MAAAAVLIASAAAFGDRADALARARTEPRAEEQLPEPEVLRHGALGFHVLLSDLWWLRAIQYYGTRSNASQQYRLLGPILEIVVGLDPEFCYAYRFAGVTVPQRTAQGWANVDLANRLLEKGMESCPTTWQIPLLRGYNAFWCAEDFEAAAEYTARAARLPGVPAYLPLLATRLYSHVGKLDVAIEFAERVLEGAEEPRIREEMETRLVDLHTERELRRAEAAIEGWRREHGEPPPSLQALVSAGHLEPLAPEPHGGSWLYDPGTGQVRSDRMAARVRLGARVLRDLERERPTGARP